MNNLKLVYWNEKNLGDLLSPYIISNISDCNIVYRKFYNGIRKQFYFFISFLLGRKSVEEFKQTLFFYEKNLLAVGSIITHGNNRSIIWGSGFMNSNEMFRGGEVCAVRGKLTNEKLIEQGFKGCNVFGDPALLLPLIVSAEKERIYDIAIIPHWSEVEYFKTTFGNKYKILDLRTDEVENFVKELTSCKYILSTSLHGIILSHAYGIPALWIKHGYIDTDGFKFYDYFSSVDIPFYDGICEYETILNTYDWMHLFVEYKNYSLPVKDVVLIQKELLRVAPFKLASKYKALL